MFISLHFGIEWVRLILKDDLMKEISDKKRMRHTGFKVYKCSR